MSGYHIWQKIWNESGAKGDCQERYLELTRFYNDPERHYHTVARFWHCLRELDGFWMQAPHRTNIGFALAYNYSVYDPRWNDNKLRSALYANETLKTAGFDEEYRIRVVECILATSQKSAPETFNEAEKFTVDIDCSILGKDSDVFDEYERGIRKEYVFVDEGSFRKERVRVLHRFLEREHIYFTERFRFFFESKARENIQRSLGRLERGEPLL